MDKHDNIELKKTANQKFVGKLPVKLIIIAIVVNLILLGIIYTIVSYLSIDSSIFLIEKN